MRSLILWEADTSHWPTNPEEVAQVVLKLSQMVENDIKEGKTKDWGAFSSGGRGYAIYEGTEEEGYLETLKYAPYIRFESHPVLTIHQVEKAYQKFANMR
jgi:hypothetical protein